MAKKTAVCVGQTAERVLGYCSVEINLPVFCSVLKSS